MWYYATKAYVCVCVCVCRKNNAMHSELTVN